MRNSETNEGDGNVRAIAQREALLRWARRLGCGALLVAVVFVGHRGYVVWRKKHLARQADEFVARGDYQSALLVSRRLLELEPDHLAACRAMAEMAEKAGQPEAVNWRQRIAHREPSVTNQLALAKAAVRFGQNDLAEHILQVIPEPSRQSVAFQQIAAAHALATQDPVAAESHFAAALKLQPDNPQLAVNLAMLQLAASNRSVATKARTTLENLLGEPKVRLEALRALTALALAEDDRPTAARWAAKLQSEPGAKFSDALLQFQSAQGTDTADVALQEIQTKAAASADTVAELIPWLNRHGMAAQVIAWQVSLPRGILETHPVPLAIAESYSLLEDWPSLRSSVTGKNWGEFEALRLAVESHALHRLNSSDRVSAEAATVWRSALKVAQTHPAQLVSIARLAEGWGYAAEAEEAWWLVANSPGDAKVGLSALQHFYRSKQDTRGLLRVARRALELNPGDLAAANNCASFGLLLAADSTARRLAEKLHAEHPANRAFAATYAYALQTAGKCRDGLKVMQTLREEELQYPAIAAYYVVMLVESGQLERARHYLANAQRAALLPEEQQLLATATRKLVAQTEEASPVRLANGAESAIPTP